MRVILDTNVVVSALIFSKSIPGQVFTSASRQHVLLASEQTLDELKSVLRRPKFDRCLALENRLSALGDFELLCELVWPLPAVSICRDPRDNCFLELAAGGRADFLVTGDEDLLVLKRFEQTAILTPRDFCSILGIAPRSG